MQSVLNKKNVTCVIPFYNEEGHNLLKIIYTVMQIPEVQEIVVVDDGSESKKTFNLLKKILTTKNPVKLIRLDDNFGKSFAIFHGLRYVSNENILLIDADLKNLDKKEISKAINKFNLLDLELLILRRVNSSRLVKLIRADTLLSGERLIKKKHLINILQSGVKNYELEVGTNQYFIKNDLHKKCFWSKSSALNNYKYKKHNFLKGVIKDIKMYVNLINYVGIINFKKQISEFCKNEV
jgi:glycosyltransferase involved in cell wall biosynthesis